MRQNDKVYIPLLKKEGIIANVNNIKEGRVSVMIGFDFWEIPVNEIELIKEEK
jgi:hypothetical protein